MAFYVNPFSFHLPWTFVGQITPEVLIDTFHLLRRMHLARCFAQRERERQAPATTTRVYSMVFHFEDVISYIRVDVFVFDIQQSVIRSDDVSKLSHVTTDL